MKNSTYWKQRFDQVEQSANNKSVKYVKRLEKKYNTAAQQIDKQINAWYQRIANNNEVTITEARKLLSDAELKEFKWNVEDYIKFGQQNAVDQSWMKELENASAKFHINRLEALKLECRQQVEQLFAGGQEAMYDTLADVYKDTFYRSCFEIQKGAGVGFDVSKLDNKQVSTLLKKPWSVDGTNFSTKLWGNKRKLINTLDQELSRMVLTGESPQKIIANVRKTMNTSQYAAKRLVLTEQAYFTSVAQKSAYGELDVEEYEIVATLDGRTSEICQDMDGQHYPVKDMQPGLNAPPFHVFCRTTTCPYFNDEFTVNDKRIAKGEDGEWYEVPASMTYPEWKNSFVDGGSKENLTILDSNGIKTLKDDENRLRYQTFESAILYNKNGEVVFEKSGQEHSVSFTAEEVRQMEGCVMTHNHPGGNSFSGQDICVLKNGKLNVIRACGKRGTYVLEKPDSWHSDIDTGQKIMRVFEELKKEVMQEVDPLFYGGKIDVDEANRMLYDNLMKKFANKYNLKYGLEIIE